MIEKNRHLEEFVHDLMIACNNYDIDKLEGSAEYKKTCGNDFFVKINISVEKLTGNQS